MLIAVLAFVLSASLLAVMVTVLVLLRKGEGPRYGASRAYDANRREALRVLTGEEVDRAHSEQWYDPARRERRPEEPEAEAFGAAVLDALRAVVPEDRGPLVERDGAMLLTGEDVRVVPAVSTAELRAAIGDEDGPRLTIGLVLLNPEPPGGEATRVALSIRALFPALERAGRADLVRRFEEIHRRAMRAPEYSGESPFIPGGDR